MENKKSLLIVLILIASAHLLLFANLKMDEIPVIRENKSITNISEINLKNVIVKKTEPKVEPVVEPIIEKVIEKPLPQTKSKNIIKQHDKKHYKKHDKPKVKKELAEVVKKTEVIKQQIQEEQNKIYPNSAKRLNQMGKVQVNFVISKDGQIKNIRIVKDSNFQRLNEAAIEILTKLNKFEPIPEKLTKNSWELTVPIVYQIKRC
jgi:protein TonB